MDNQNDNPQMYRPVLVYTNQKIITIKEYNFTEPYGTISRQAEQLACKTLRCYPTAYMLYIHLALHQKDYTFGLSPRGIFKEIGLSKSQYDKSVKTLKEHGFLVPNDRFEFGYDFYAIPLTEHTETIPSPPTDTHIYTDSDTVSQQIPPTAPTSNDNTPLQTTLVSRQTEDTPIQTAPISPPQMGYTPPQTLVTNNTSNNTSNSTSNNIENRTINTTDNMIEDIENNTTEDIIMPTDEDVNRFIEEQGFIKRYDEGVLKINDNYQELTKEEFIEVYKYELERYLPF